MTRKHATKSGVAILPLLLCLLGVSIEPVSGQGEVGFVERFALAEDREAVLSELVAGTEAYYWYHALYYEQTKQWDKQNEITTAWAKRYPHSEKLKEILNRRAIFAYAGDPKGSLEYIRRILGIRFDHQRDTPEGREPDLPTSLGQDKISWKAFLEQVLQQEQNISQIRDRALDRLIRDGVKLNDPQRRHLLSRISRPDHPGLVEMLLEELDTKESGGFGSFQVHGKLLPDQLDEMAKARPELMRNRNFISTKITKLWPGADEDLSDPAVRAAFLDRVWKLVGGLDPAFNDLKVQVLAQILELAKKRGEYDRERFIEYLKLPRSVGYVNPVYLKREDISRHVVSLGADYSSVLRMPVVHDDQPLVKDYLEHFFLEDEDYEEFSVYIRETYLKPIFAEVKLLAGIGDPERWYSMLGASQVKALRDRVDIEFLATNPERFGKDDKVEVAVDVKNVKTLIVRAYEINTLNYYLNYGNEVTTDLDLDGLVANFEEIHKYDDAPIRRVRREFEFPHLEGKRGVWVLEFIGNGKSSRALVRKGSLQYLAKTTAVGEAIKVFDGENNPIPDATVWAGGREYKPNENGVMIVPFSGDPGRKQLVMVSDGFAALDFFEHPAENYDLSAGFHVDREELLTRGKAALLVRPNLTVNGEAAPLEILEDVKLTIVSTDQDGVQSSEEVKKFELNESGETVHVFRVPERLSSLVFQLDATVERPSAGDKVNLSASRALSINTINGTMETHALHVSRIGDGYVLEVIGKGGEPFAGRAVQVACTHRAFTIDRWFSLKTNAAGQVNLGALNEIESIRARTEGAKEIFVELPEDRALRGPAIHVPAGELVEVPFFGTGDPLGAEVSLLEVRNGTFVSDQMGKLEIKDGYLVAKDLAPGDYNLLLRSEGNSGTEINVRVGDGELNSGYILGNRRHLEAAGLAPLQISSLNVEGEELVIRLGNASEGSRVHVFASRFIPDFDAYAALAGVPGGVPMVIVKGRLVSNYVSGRTIGEEYRYIIDRRYADRYPGNMLTRPGLLLNPWAIRETDTGVQVAQDGEDYQRLSEGERGNRKGTDRPGGGNVGSSNSHPDLNYLRNVSPVVANLSADEDGVIRVPLEEFKDRQFIRVIALDWGEAISRDLALDEDNTKLKDVRLTDGLDPDSASSEQRRITVLDEGEKLVINDPASSDVQIVDDQAGVYGLLSTLNPHPHLVEFGFILRWSKMEDEEKRTTYSKYACHELSFWISKQDPEFFEGVVKPYLANKRHKTFMDDYLVGNDLKKYLKRWEFARLNAVERILLGRALGGGDKEKVARLMEDLVDLIPPDPEGANRLFETALLGSSLSSGSEILELADGIALDRFSIDEAEAKQEGNWKGLATRPKLAAAMEKPAAATQSAPADPAATPEPEPDAPAEMEERDMDDALSDKSELRARAGKKLSKEQEFGYLTAGTVTELREDLRQLYRKMDKTWEWAENNYYKLRIHEQGTDLIKANAFWEDYAKWDGEGQFYSGEFLRASGNFSEMMLAMAVLGLPAESGEHELEVVEGKLEIVPGSAVIVFHKEILPAEDFGDAKPPLLVGQNFFDPIDRYRHTQEGKVDKFVVEEMLYGKVYGCQVVMTNPTSTAQRIDVLTQIPEGAVPVAGGRQTRSVPMTLEPYTTRKLEYLFYFPQAIGKTSHYPVQVSIGGQSVAAADPSVFEVVEKLTKVDEASWDHISQWADADAVIEFLGKENLGRINLDRMAWRLRDKGFFERVVALLEDRHFYHPTTWSYGMYHNVLPVAQQFLLHQDSFLGNCGRLMNSELVVIDPIARHWYEHLEYSPVANARAHRLGAIRKIPNDAIHAQYHAFLVVQSYVGELDSAGHAAACYYLLLQDRVDEGIAHFDRIKPEELSEKIQYDYLRCYVGFYQGETDDAREIAGRYADHPVDRWRQRFGEVVAHLDEIDGKDVAVQDEENREQAQDELASTEPTFDLKVEDKVVMVTYQNIGEVQVNYYEMDLEFLFSTNPFVEGGGDRFSIVRPNASDRVVLPEGRDSHDFKLPAEFQSKNVLVEISGAGQKKAQAYYAHALKVNLAENYGRVQVMHEADGRPLPKTYVKVYARMNDGSVKFFKDGYTDLRGKFDYSSLNTDEINRAVKFSILVMHDEHGALVREVEPPQR